MMRVVILLGVVAVTMIAAEARFGYWPVYQVGYGAFALMAAMVSLTFLWLWAKRETTLALGMSISWAGAASVMGWWWVYHVLSQPEVMAESQLLFVFLAVYFVGAVLHFETILRSFGYGTRAFAVPVAAALAIALAVELLV